MGLFHVPRSSQKTAFCARDGVARMLSLSQATVHGIWVPGPGSYGRNDAGDAGIDAALLSKAVGRCGSRACVMKGTAGTPRARPRSTALVRLSTRMVPWSAMPRRA